jgi:hypothetical protein
LVAAYSRWALDEFIWRKDAAAYGPAVVVAILLGGGWLLYWVLITRRCILRKTPSVYRHPKREKEERP